jgi:hypothetical protein
MSEPARYKPSAADKSHTACIKPPCPHRLALIRASHAAWQQACLHRHDAGTHLRR